MAAQIFKFAPKFPKIRGFGPKFCIFQENVPTSTNFLNFPTAQNLGEEQLLPLATTPLNIGNC